MVKKGHKRGGQSKVVMFGMGQISQQTPYSSEAVPTLPAKTEVRRLKAKRLTRVSKARGEKGANLLSELAWPYHTGRLAPVT